MKKMFILIIIFIIAFGLAPEALSNDRIFTDEIRSSPHTGIKEGKYIVQFQSEPIASHRELITHERIALKLALQNEHNQFRGDLEKIRSSFPSSKQSVKANVSLSNYEYFTVFNGVAVSLTDKELEAVKKLHYVKHIYPDRKHQLYLSDSVPLINADDVWTYLGATGNGIIVAVIDTGIDYTHPDLGGGFGSGYKVIGGYDFGDDDADPIDPYGHGTHCSGIVAANGSVVGVAPNANLMALKVIDSTGEILDSYIIAAIEYACDPDSNPATDDAVDVISMSLGTPGSADDDVCQAVDNAVDLGVVCAIAAGNDHYYETIGSPGCARKAFTVGATNKGDGLADFSSRGPAPITSGIKPEVCAPGVLIRSTILGGGTAAVSGTSMATPHVAGASALLLELYPDWTPSQIKSALMSTAKDLNLDVMTQGAGRIDVYAAAQVEIVVEPGDINLGYDDLTLATWTVNKPLTVTNVSTEPVIYNFSVDQSNLPSGVSTSITSYVSLNPGESTTVDFEVIVDNDTVPNLFEPPYVYYGYIIGESDDKAVRLPFAFNKEQPDTMEPNNNSTEATFITIEEKRKQIFALGRTKIDPMQLNASYPDEDWFSFQAEAGQILFVYVESSLLNSLFIPLVELYDSSLSLLETANSVYTDNRITFFTIPASDTYYLRIAGEEEINLGHYKLYANFLPSEVNYYWIPDEPVGGNPINCVEFSDNENYFYTTQDYNYLTLFETSGTGTPVYSFTGYLETKFLSASKNGSIVASVNAHESSDDTWLYDSTDWIKSSPTTSPGHIYGHSMAYDSVRGQAVLFGGLDENHNCSDDTWVWDGTNWTKLNPIDKPPPRCRANMVYDSNRQVTILYGGYDPESGELSDTWEWDGTNWTEIITASSPSISYDYGFAFDSNRSIVVLFGGYPSATWEYNGLTWLSRFSITSPDYGDKSTMAYDISHNETVLITEDPPETWTWNGSIWTQKFPATVPSVNSYHWNMVFDSSTNKIVLLAQSSNSSNHLMETWEWDGSDWTQISTTNTPTMRRFFGMVYDFFNQETMLYGGEYFDNSVATQELEVRSTPSTSTIFNHTLDYPNEFTGLKVFEDGSRLVTSNALGEIEIIDASGIVIKEINFPSGEGIIQEVSADGSVAVLNGPIIYDLVNEFERPGVPLVWYMSIKLSDDGSRIVCYAVNQLSCYQWNGTLYELLWQCEMENAVDDANISGDGSTVFAVIRNKVMDWFSDLGLNYYLFDGDTGQQIFTYKEPKDVSLHLQASAEEVSINYNGSLIAVASWGGYRKYSELLVFSPECGVPIFELGTPGSGTTVDVSGNYVCFGTKGVHTNAPEGGGEVYSVDLTENLSHIPPLITDVEASPQFLFTRQTVTITCKATDDDGVANILAQIESPDEYVIAALTLHDDGAHDDGGPNDDMWGIAWITDGIPRDYVVDIIATDNNSDTATYDDVVSFVTKDMPSLSHLWNLYE